nr:RNA-directed DNA polymerase, eukaryota, reverse transcriptase zinc-binding domain protein [Tanacetum cinerariifolium]
MVESRGESAAHKITCAAYLVIKCEEVMESADDGVFRLDEEKELGRGSGTEVKEKESAVKDSLAKENTTGLGSSHETNTTGNAPGKSSYANGNGQPSGKKLNIRTLFTPRGNGIDVVVPVESIRAISDRFANTAYGFFLGKRVAYPVVANYVRNTWGRSSYARVMIELRADVELTYNIVVAMPKITKEGHYTCNVRVEYEWKPPRCSFCKVFGHIHEECPKNTGAGKLRLLYNDGNPLVPTCIVESDSEVEVVFGETANLRIATSGKDESGKGYGTNSFLEQWGNSYPDNYDYDPYDDDMYENHDLSEHLQSICDDLDITDTLVYPVPGYFGLSHIKNGYFGLSAKRDTLGYPVKKTLFYLDTTRKYTVNGMRTLTTSQLSPDSLCPTLWNKFVTIKINICSWRIMNKRIPTRTNLDSRRIDLHSVRCPICDDDIETEEHIFLKCKVAAETWKQVLKWWSLVIRIQDLDDVFTIAKRSNMSPVHSKVIDAVVHIGPKPNHLG